VHRCKVAIATLPPLLLLLLLLLPSCELTSTELGRRRASCVRPALRQHQRHTDMFHHSRAGSKYTSIEEPYTVM
jgi:hypothetical protein